MALKVYNTLTREKEEFKSLQPGQVKMYCCGPTVYDFLHIGNFRGAVFYNFVKNWLEKSGYKVTFVYNFTDVDDKIINKAIAEKSTAKDIAEKFIGEFKKDFSALELKPHDHTPRVTEHIPGIIKLVEKLIANKKAYVADGEVFYSISSFPEYGKLSNRKPEDMLAGARVEVDPKKQNSLDFTLWKPAKPGEQSWPSPWGDGRPGWHIECSCMIHDILGEQIDIHGGGMDLIFPHHENEIAQGEGASGKPYARYWLHNNMFMFSGAKMSKSLGNIRTMRSFLQEYPAEVYKFLVMSAHYRSESEFSPTTIDNSIAGLVRIYSALRIADDYIGKASGAPGPEVKKFTDAIKDAQARMHESYNDDFNTPKALADIYEIVRLFNAKFKTGMKATPDLSNISAAFKAFIVENGAPLALFQQNPAAFLKTLDLTLIRQKNLDVNVIEDLVKKRVEARIQKNYALSDELRKQLTEMGIEVRDAANESTWEVIK